MTSREQNRLREHGGAGHQLTEGEANAFQVAGYAPGSARFYRCTCGWFGWLTAGLLPQGRDLLPRTDG